MRPLLFSLALLLAACSETAERPPPSDRFIFPSGIVYRSVPGSTNGILYVASANYDRCYDQGTLMAVDLDRMGPGIYSDGKTDAGSLQPIGSYTNTDLGLLPAKFEQLNLASQSTLFIQSYAGEMALKEGATPRLFVPARADGDFVHYIDIDGSDPTRLSCVGTSSKNCAENALSLTHNLSGQTADLPRAPAPFGVSVDPSGSSVWVTHLNLADSPAGSGNSATARESYVVGLPSDTPSVSAGDFYPLSITNLPLAGGNSVIADDRYVFVSGRGPANSTQARRFLLRALRKPVPETDTPAQVLDPGLDLGFAADEARGMALTAKVAASDSSPRRLYMAVRTPDSLVTVNVAGLESDSPSLTVVGAIPLPNGPTEVALVPRGSARSELVLVSCSAAGVVAIYDPDVGQVVAQVSVGQISGTTSPQPFGLAVQQQGNAARVFVSNFGDGRVSVIDISDLNSPQLARLVAHLGARQDQASSTCQEVQQ
ncbi:YncE family protein [Vitiosangium sp. GDMCC 1.1324]|uniref:YncE family protein n=1 Tax=Vitiosangium sp. (strain GDMCC 1.1324) TaxID=2138576 RepID=UPI000D3B5382|nr:hypothetical protein [Vitiosangium sp. GDMCC 1.1324]PTL76321.1 hypothetical protein DAT35_50690 [Vitiosangium sp. GDMCC 1.1324]